MRKKVMIAAGGTGGHLFPAQGLAEELLASGNEVIFAGANLSTNRYFKRDQFRFVDVQSATPFRRSLRAVFKALICLVKGIREGCLVLSREAPDVIVGFGSFHSFSVLVAARIKKIPYVLFESNALPGKVNRLFSKAAAFTAVYFPCAAQHLRGEVIEVEMPVRRTRSQITPQEARRYFGLQEDLFTIVVFGGSQGSAKLNKLFTETALEVFQSGVNFQVIHLAGNPDAADQVRERYRNCGMPVCVKDFETEMDFSYTAASLVVSRAGAATVAELVAFAQPSILVPYPYASENHQQKNAEFLTHELKAAIHFQESELSSEMLSAALKGFLDPKQTRCAHMKLALEHYQAHQFKATLCPLICHLLHPS